MGQVLIFAGHQCPFDVQLLQGCSPGIPDARAAAHCIHKTGGLL